VQGVVDPPVPGPGQAVADLVAGGDVDGGGAVIAGEGVLSGELGHIADLGDDPPCDHRPDAIQTGQASAGRGDQGSDLGADVFDPGVEGADVGEGARAICTRTWLTSSAGAGYERSATGESANFRY